MTTIGDVLAEMPTDHLPGRGAVDPESAMRWCHTPGASVALIDGGELRETWTAGVRTAGGADPVTPETRFQAGSISKAVAAAVALRLVADGVLDLDADVNGVLRSWRIPANDGWQARITPRHLLSHTSGLTVHGFPGYPAGSPVPDLPAILDGRGNTPPVRVTSLPGVQFSYSGGGYVVLQQLLADVTGTDFATLADDLVLRPLGMADSSYVQRPYGSAVGDTASGHRAGPVPVAGHWHAYPEMAAAGLWTTPTDLARFFLALRDSLSGRPGALLPRDLAGRMASPHAANRPYGLGLQLSRPGAPFSIGHGGTDEGFRCRAVLFPDAGRGMVAMTNSDGGDALIDEFLAPALARRYGWPEADPPSAPPAGDLTGRYRAGGLAFRIDRAGGDLTLTVDGQPAVPLRAGPDGGWRAVPLNVELRRPAPGRLVVHQPAEYTVDIEATRE